jgi:hypothetical protein
MGCDIHGWVEIKENGKWIAVKELKNDDRNYKRFAALAGVRDYEKTSQATPKGIPVDVSDTVDYHIRHFGVDGHSHSYMPISDAAKIFLETDYKTDDLMQKFPVYYYFGMEEDDDGVNCRLVFWFDN